MIPYGNGSKKDKGSSSPKKAKRKPKSPREKLMIKKKKY